MSSTIAMTSATRTNKWTRGNKWTRANKWSLHPRRADPGDATGWPAPTAAAPSGGERLSP